MTKIKFIYLRNARNSLEEFEGEVNEAIAHLEADDCTIKSVQYVQRYQGSGFTMITYENLNDVWDTARTRRDRAQVREAKRT